MADAERRFGLPLRPVKFEACINMGSIDPNSNAKLNVIDLTIRKVPLLANDYAGYPVMIAC